MQLQNGHNHLLLTSFLIAAVINEFFNVFQSACSRHFLPNMSPLKLGMNDDNVA